MAGLLPNAPPASVVAFPILAHDLTIRTALATEHGNLALKGTAVGGDVAIAVLAHGLARGAAPARAQNERGKGAQGEESDWRRWG